MVSRSRLRRIALLLVLCLAMTGALAAALPGAALAKRKRQKTERVPYRAALLVEAETGRVLREENPRLQLVPASMVKMMVVLITIERIKEKSVHLTDIVTTSRRASKIGGQQVYLAQGEQFSLEDLLKAVIIASANDASYAVAEHVAGDAEIFVEMMNERAKKLGMTDTRFVNVHGLPPNRGEPPNLMSARDAAILGRELLKHPIVTSWSGQKTAPFRDGKFTLSNTNLLVGRFPGVDGLKTGSYRAAGYSVVATAKRNGLRLVAVIFGSSHPRLRFTEARRLLAWGFARYRWIDAAKKHPVKEQTVKVQKGQKKEVSLQGQGSIRALVKRGEEANIMATPIVPAFVSAPVKKGQQIGQIVYKLDGKKLGELPLVAAESVAKAGFFQNLLGR